MQLRLTSPKAEPREGFTPMTIHVPGLIRWAKAGYGASKENDKVMVRIIAESFGLKREVALAMLSGEVEVVVDGEDVLVQWPDDSPLDEGGA